MSALGQQCALSTVPSVLLSVRPLFQITPHLHDRLSTTTLVHKHSYVLMLSTWRTAPPGDVF